MAFENNAMRISELLCSSPRSQEEEKASLPSHDERDLSLQVQTPVCTFTTSMTPKFVPDKERKRPYRMSAAQRQHRQECEAFESRVYNLTLDINELRQQIQRLMEFRDLHLNRLLLNNQRFEGDVLNMAWRLLDGLRGGAFGLTPSSRSMFSSRTHVCQRDAAASGAVHQYVMQRGRPTFSRPTFGIKSIRVVALVDRLTPGDKAREIRYVCGSDASCVVEVLANVTGQITRDTLIALLPHVLSDESLVSQIIGQRVTFSSRLLLYFNSQRRIVQQVAQADLVAALRALQIGGPREFAPV